MYLTGPHWFFFKIKLISTWKLQMTMTLAGYWSYTLDCCVSNLLFFYLRGIELRLRTSFRLQKILKNIKSWNEIYWLFDESWLDCWIFPGQPSWLLRAQPASVFLSSVQTETRWAVSKIITRKRLQEKLKDKRLVPKFDEKNSFLIVAFIR